jgi:hypothetical protein
MNTMIRNRNSADAALLAEEAHGDAPTRSGDRRRDRMRAVQELVGRILSLAPAEVADERVRDSAGQVAALASAVPDGGEADADALLAAGYAPPVVEGVRRLTRPTGRLTLVQDSEDLARSGDVALMAVRYAEMTYDSLPERIMRLPHSDRGVLGVYHKSRKALAAGFLEATGADLRTLDEAGTLPEQGPAHSLEEVRDAVSKSLDGLPQLPLALALLDHMAARAPREMTLGEALAAMGREGPDQASMAALAFLAQSPKPALNAGVVFRDERGTVYPVSDEERGAVEAKGYRHPVTGEPVPDPESRFFVRIVPIPGLFPTPVPEAAPADGPAAGPGEAAEPEPEPSPAH